MGLKYIEIEIQIKHIFSLIMKLHCTVEYEIKLFARLKNIEFCVVVLGWTKHNLKNKTWEIAWNPVDFYSRCERSIPILGSHGQWGTTPSKNEVTHFYPH